MSKFQSFILVLITSILVFLLIKIQITFVEVEKLKNEIHQELYGKDEEKLVALLKVHEAFDKDGLIKLKRYGKPNDGGYAVPEKAFKMADVLLGYGIADDNSFEEDFSSQYNKPSFGFDCGIDKMDSNNKLFRFVREWIANDKFLYNPKNSSKQITSFGQQLSNLHLKGKNIFIKMDIEGAEYEAFEDIIMHAPKIMGIALEIHIMDSAYIKQAVKLLADLQKDFILLHVHGNNCTDTFTTRNSIGNIPKALELTFINKALVSTFHLAKDQKHPQPIDMATSTVYSVKDAEFEIYP